MPDATQVPSWITLLIQVPLVGVFIWYSLEMSKRSAESQRAFMEALDKRDHAFEQRNTAVIQAINNLNASICAQIKEAERAHEDHDRYVRDKLSTRSSRSKST
jgi:hypothetical protein